MSNIFPVLASSVLLLLALKVTAVLGAGYVAARALHAASAGVRHAVWLVVLGCSLLLPLGAGLPPIRVAVLPTVATGSVGRATAGGSVDRTTGRASARPMDAQAGRPIHTQASPQRGRPIDRATLFALFYLAVSAALLARLGVGVVRVRRIVRRSTDLQLSDEWARLLRAAAARMNVGTSARVVMSSDVTTAFVCGPLAPVIVLPSLAAQWPRARRTAVLLHEMAHVRRNDLLGHALAQIACAFYWWHPLAWVAARRMRCESERACDDAVLARGVGATDYAQHLLDLVLHSGRRGAPAPAVALLMARRSEFEGRLLAILDDRIRRAAPARVPVWAAAGTVGALAVCIGAIQPVHAADASSTALNVLVAPPRAPAAEKQNEVSLIRTSSGSQVTAPLRRSIDGPAGQSVDDSTLGRATDRSMDQPPDVALTTEQTVDTAPAAPALAERDTTEQHALGNAASANAPRGDDKSAPSRPTDVEDMAAVAPPVAAAQPHAAPAEEELDSALAWRGFYERRRDAQKGALWGRFITSADIERQSPYRVSDLITVPSIHVAPGSSVLYGTNLCPVNVYLDGTRLNRVLRTGMEYVAIDGMVLPTSVAGMEIYERESVAPPAYQSPFARQNCGVVVIWTRS